MTQYMVVEIGKPLKDVTHVDVWPTWDWMETSGIGWIMVGDETYPTQRAAWAAAHRHFELGLDPLI